MRRLTPALLLLAAIAVAPACAYDPSPRHGFMHGQGFSHGYSHSPGFFRGYGPGWGGRPHLRRSPPPWAWRDHRYDRHHYRRPDYRSAERPHHPPPPQQQPQQRRPRTLGEALAIQ